MKPVDYEDLKPNLDINEQADFRFQERRHAQWKENYELFRDTVIMNRLTQRQAVNIPLMKETIKTILSNIDDFPAIEFEDLGNNKQRELFFNTYWQDIVTNDNLELKDVLDTKQVLLYGRSWMKLNIIDGRFSVEVREPYDILVDRYADPTDLDATANHLIEVNIFRTIGQLEETPEYDQAAVGRMKMAYASTNGFIPAEQVTRIMQAKAERLQDMGVSDANMQALGQTEIGLKTHYIKVWDDEDQEQHIHVIVMAEGEILLAKPLMEVLGVDFFPFVTWADDPERNDIYSDGVADIVRTVNKVLNVWISQLSENRTLRNFGMNYYDATANPNWTPQTFNPEPFGWIPLPGNPSEIFQKVDVPELEETIDEINFLKSLVESATAATAATKGDTERGDVTLGEVQLTTQAAKERITSISKFRLLARKELGIKFQAIANANSDKLDEVKLYKKSHKGNWFKKKVAPEDWQSKEGYTCKVVSSAEREQKSIETLQKIKAVTPDFVGNSAFQRIVKKKELDFLQLNPDEVKEIMDFDKQHPTPMQPPGQPGQPGQPQPQPQLTPQPNAATAQQPA